MSDVFDRELRTAFGDGRVHRNEPLARFTTFRVGGRADWLLELRSGDEVRRAAAFASREGIPITVLGGGSNVLVSDRGVRGIVVRMHGGEVASIDSTRVRADGGVTINGLVRWTVVRGVAGLEAWAGTPGTVGGAIHGNAHFRGRLIGDLVESVTLTNSGGALFEASNAEMEFGYDYSRLHRTGEIVIAGVLRVGRGDPDSLRAIARESLAFRKRTQPLESPSAGCVFQNPDPARDAVPEGIPPSAGALVDRAGLKGERSGGASVSTTHANFIVNDGRATAADIRQLIERCKREVQQRFGVSLREEIVYLGFE